MCKRVRYWKKIVEETASGIGIQRAPYTFVELGFALDGKTYIASGFSKRCPRDEWDSKRGVTIAKGRAAKQIARKLVDEGYITSGEKESSADSTGVQI